MRKLVIGDIHGGYKGLIQVLTMANFDYDNDLLISLGDVTDGWSEVAEMVYCVTDELGRNRVEKKAKTLPKTASNPKAIELKLGDRIANIEHGGKIDMYAKEYSQFKGVLFLNSPKDAEAMWHHLEKNLLKLEEYTT